jgi:hypothetical protein
MKLFIFSSFVIALLIFFSACKKQEDTSPPVIVMNSPSQSQLFHVFDTIQVNLTVSDDKHLDPVAVTLLNASGTAAMATAMIQVNGKTGHIAFGYELGDIHLSSGNYSLKVAASDGVNVTSSFVHIQIVASPSWRKGIYLISRNTSAVFVSRLDTNYLISPLLSLNGDYSGSDLSSYFQKLYVSGAYTGNFNAISLSSGSISWFKPVVQGSSPWFDGASVFSNLVYLPYFNGSIKAFDTSGHQRFNLMTQANYHPGKLLVSGKYILNEQIYITNNSSKLVVCNSSSGLGIQELGLNQTVVQFSEKDPDNIFIFGNSSGQGLIELYSISGNGIWSPHALPAGEILSAAQVDPDTYLIGLSDGNVYKYQYSVNSLTIFLSGITASVLRYDALKNEVLTSYIQTISMYDYLNASLKHTVVHSDTILNFHVLNNK